MSPTLDIPSVCGHAYRADRTRSIRRRGRPVINGQVEFYDEDTAWGLIRGDDGRLYDVRGSQLSGPPPRVCERMLFEPQTAPGIPRVMTVRRVTAAARIAGRG